MKSSKLKMMGFWEDDLFLLFQGGPVYSQVNQPFHREGGVASTFCSPRFFLFCFGGGVGFPYPKKAPGSVSSNTPAGSACGEDQVFAPRNS